MDNRKDSFVELNPDQMETVSGGARGAVGNDTKERKWIKYHVVDGDTLWSIKKRYNCTVTDIKKWNNLKSEVIGPWMVLDLFTDNY